MNVCENCRFDEGAGCKLYPEGRNHTKSGTCAYFDEKMPEMPYEGKTEPVAVSTTSRAVSTVKFVSEDEKWLPIYARPASMDEIEAVGKAYDALPAALRNHAEMGVFKEYTIGIVSKEHKSSAFGAQILFSIYDMMHRDEITRNIWYQLIHTAVNPSVIAANGGADAMYNEILDAKIALPQSISSIIEAFNHDAYEGIDDLLALIGLTYKDGIGVDEQAQQLCNTLAPATHDDSLGDRWDMEDAVAMVKIWRNWMGIEEPATNTDFDVGTLAQAGKGFDHTCSVSAHTHSINPHSHDITLAVPADKLGKLT